jgi:hypothetical protein
MPDIESQLIIAGRYSGGMNVTSMDYKKSPFMKSVKQQETIIITPYNLSMGRNYFCVFVSSQGKGIELGNLM